MPVGAARALPDVRLDREQRAELLHRFKEIAVFRVFVHGRKLFAAGGELRGGVRGEDGVQQAGKAVVVQRVFVGVADLLRRVVWRARQVQQHKGVEVYAEHRAEAVLDALHIRIPARRLRREVEGGQHGEFGAFGAVVAPHREEDVLHAFFAAGGKRGGGCGDAVPVVRRKAAPDPEPAREPDVLLDGGMRLDLFVVALLVGGVVVPIDQVHVCGDFLFYLVGYGQMVHIIRAAADEPEEHIAPHDQLEAVCCGNLGVFSSV